MIENGRKTIGVFITQIQQEFQTSLSKGINTLAQKLGYNVIFFGYFNSTGQQRFETGENYITDIPIYEDLDGFIVATDVIDDLSLKEKVSFNIKNRCKCPVVSVGGIIDGAHNILINDDIILDNIIRHFIEYHGFTRINMLTGVKEKEASIKRLNSYKRILKEYNIPVEEDRIYFGDFWINSADAAVEKWLASPLERPQAIICANDIMAISLCEALRKRGILVPEDIAVSGCDDITNAAVYSPEITTVRTPVVEMGEKAVELIHNMNKGILQDKIIYMDGTTLYRESCGCSSKNTNRNKKSNTILSKADKFESAILTNAYMSSDLTGVTTLEEVDEKLDNYIDNSVDTFFILLKKDWDVYRDETEKHLSDSETEYIMEYGMKQGKKLDKARLSVGEFLPARYLEDKPQIFFITVLHYQENYLGYAAISFKDVHTYDASYQGWLANISNALENIRIHSEMKRLVYKLEDMYIRDELTGLYNRHGLQVLGQKYLKQCIEEETGFFVFTADMDKLKLINDNYGHVNGDIAIKVVADALQNAADDDEICIRGGGDEFHVIGMEYDEKKVGQFVKKFLSNLDEFNKDDTHIYSVEVSYGSCLLIPDEKTTIEECLTVADAKMYGQKYQKETLRKLHEAL